MRKAKRHKLRSAGEQTCGCMADAATEPRWHRGAIVAGIVVGNAALPEAPG